MREMDERDCQHGLADTQQDEIDRKRLEGTGNLIHISGAIFTDPDNGATVDVNRLYADYRRLQIEAQQLRELQPDKLRHTLEVIAVGDAEDPKAAATDVLVDIGFWDAAAVAELKDNPSLPQGSKAKKPSPGVSKLSM